MFCFSSNNFALKGKRKTITAQDVLSALEDMEFDQFVDPLKECLAGRYMYIETCGITRSFVKNWVGVGALLELSPIKFENSRIRIVFSPLLEPSGSKGCKIHYINVLIRLFSSLCDTIEMYISL